MQQLIDIELEKVYLRIPREVGKSLYSRLGEQLEKGGKPAKRKTKNAGAVKDEWEELCASGQKLAKKRGFTEKDVMSAIYKSRYNETA